MTLIPTREIIFDRETHDYAMYLDGELVGFERTYHRAEIVLDELVFELMSGQVVYARPAEGAEPIAAKPAPECKMDVLGTRWTVCGAPAEGPCYCDVIVRALPTPEPYDDTLTIPARDLDGQCDNCGDALDGLGQCWRCIEDAEQARQRNAEADGLEPSPAPSDIRICEGLQFPCTKPVAACFHLSIGHDISGLPVSGSLELCEEHATEWERNNPRPTRPFCFFCPGAGHDTRDCPRVEGFEDTSPSVFDPPTSPVDHSRALTFRPGLSLSIRQPPRCACGQIAIIDEPAGLFCNGCHEARCLWQLWRDDPTELVAELRRQSVRLDEMAARLTTYLACKTGQNLSRDAVLAIWRNLLGDDDEPRYYLVLA